MYNHCKVTDLDYCLWSVTNENLERKKIVFECSHPVTHFHEVKQILYHIFPILWFKSPFNFFFTQCLVILHHLHTVLLQYLRNVLFQ